MSNKGYDIIIPVGVKDVNFVPRVVYMIERYLADYNIVYVITQSKYVSIIVKAVQHFSFCKVIDENKLIPNLSFTKVRECIRLNSPQHVNLTGWYFQQFLKLGFSYSSFCGDYYLSWDADTLPLAPIKFFEGEHILYNPKHENHQNYFNTTNRLLGFGKLVEDSFISESMMFSSKMVKEMLSQIESSTVNGKDWIEKIINACDFRKSPQAFSEFETYGNFCAMFSPKLYEPRHLNTFREAGMICGRYISDTHLSVMAFDLDLASFEKKHSPIFPIISSLLWRVSHWRLVVNDLSCKDLIKIVKCKLGI